MEKQERRRKIISRGTDRMALITGRIQTLEPEPLSKSSSFSIPHEDHPSPVPQHARSSSEPVTPNNEALFQDSRYFGGANAPDRVTKQHNDEKIPKQNDLRTRAPDLQKVEEKKVVTLMPDNAKLVEKPDYLLGSITPREINFSIMSTEDIRVICSVALAFLVVLSHVNLPPNVKPKSLITYRPLYLVMLTDVIIVAAKLSPLAQTKKGDAALKIDPDDGQDLGAFKYLELGLVLHQTICALFIDCSVYLVVAVCGVSMV